MSFILVFLLIFSGIIAVDFTIKYLLLTVLSEQPLYILGDWFSFNLHYNKFIAFSIPVNFNFLMVFNTFLILILFYILFVVLKNDSNISKKITISLLLIGALLNFIDRLLYSYVIDYISIWRFPIFNLADVLIVGGAFTWLYIEYREQCPRSSTDRTISS